jgi:hypothetical protein
MEGYLFKRSSKAFKTWHRRWFMIKGEKFVSQQIYTHLLNKVIQMYIKKSGDSSLQSMVMEENLKLCLVRPAPMNVERCSCFELVSRNGSHLLQADSDMLCYEWIHAIQATIQHLHEGDSDQKSNKQLPFLKNIEASTSSFNQTMNETDPSSRLQSSINSKSNARSGGASRTTAGILENSMSFFEEVRQIPGNRACAGKSNSKKFLNLPKLPSFLCNTNIVQPQIISSIADCGNSDSKWASINLGVSVSCLNNGLTLLGCNLYRMFWSSSFTWSPCFKSEITYNGRLN